MAGSFWQRGRGGCGRHAQVGTGTGGSVTAGQNQSSPGRVLLTREGRSPQCEEQCGFNEEVTSDFWVWLRAGAGDRQGEHLEGGSGGPGETR